MKKISHHENSITLKSCIVKISQQGFDVPCIDKQLVLQVETEKIYWKIF